MHHQSNDSKHRGADGTNSEIWVQDAPRTEIRTEAEEEKRRAAKCAASCLVEDASNEYKMLNNSFD